MVDKILERVPERIPEEILSRQISDILFERDYNTIAKTLTEYRKAERKKKGEGSIMSLQKAEAYLESKGFLDHVITLEESTATVALAAQALGVQPGMIAKTMSFLQGDQVVLILTEGDGEGG